MMTQLNKNDEWIQNADLKLSIILAFQGVLGGIYLTRIESSVDTYELSLASYVALLVSIVFLLVSIYFSMKGLTAKLKNPFQGLWFFGDVAQFEHWSHFKKSKLHETADEQIDTLFNQVHVTSKIAMIKFKWLNRAIQWVVMSLFVFFLFSISLYLS